MVTKDGKLICLDAKIGFDDNAVFRHPDIEALRDFDQEEPAEVEASRLGLSYVKLDGTIGCMVNGAGLAMATMDIIKLRGGEPANFLDVGGGASKEKIAEAFKIILSDPHVKGVFVNIFGGIMRCDVIAEGIIEAAREVHIGVPLVVRLEGTNVARGKALLDESGLAIISGRRSRRCRQENRRGRRAKRPRRGGLPRSSRSRQDAVNPAPVPGWGVSTMAVVEGVIRACPQCGGEAFQRAPALFLARWQIAECALAGSSILRNPPDYKHLVSDFAWEKTRAAEVERRKPEAPDPHVARRHDPLARRHLLSRIADRLQRLFKPGRVLDVGCGSGKKVPEPFIPFGVEISAELCPRGRRAYADAAAAAPFMLRRSRG